MFSKEIHHRLYKDYCSIDYCLRFLYKSM